MRVKAENPDVSRWSNRVRWPGAVFATGTQPKRLMPSQAPVPWCLPGVLGRPTSITCPSTQVVLACAAARWISHVVQTIEETDQVERSGVTIGAGHLERHIVEAESELWPGASTDGQKVKPVNVLGKALMRR